MNIHVLYMFMHMSYELLRILYNIRLGILLWVRRLCWYNFDHNRCNNTVSIIVAHLCETVQKLFIFFIPYARS